MILLDDILKEIESSANSALFFTPPIYDDTESIIFHSPSKIIEAYDESDLEKCLSEIEYETEKGAIAYGLLNYECGFFFEKKLNKFLHKNGSALATFCLFDKNNVSVVKSKDILLSDWSPGSFHIKNFSLNTSKEKFITDVDRIKKYIAAGDTYQVNYTVKGKFGFSGSSSELFKSMIFNQSAEYSAFINAGDKFILSSSPELFFEVSGNLIQTRPMKGTIKRGNDFSTDSYSHNELKNSEKDKAENVMIVDLLRNDLGRISEYGSVNVDALFEIEKYESLFQMTSTISARIRDDIKLKDIFKNIFPCGSITGAPKIRTMEIINEIESEARGLYTGSIGLVMKGKCVFNVVIRTIEINKASGQGEIGLGAGIVWDSDPVNEYEETVLKSSFLARQQVYFELFETMLIKNCTIYLFDEHLERMKSASEFFLFNYDEKKVRDICKSLTQKCEPVKQYKLKIRLSKWGEITASIKPYEKFIGEIKAILSGKTADSNNCFQYFKTTNRKLYDDEYESQHPKGFFDVIFTNENKNITEGAITNIFIVKNDTWFTPPISDGLLNGIQRAYLLHTKENIVEKSLTRDDLFNADSLYLSNSVRGLVKVDKLFVKDEVIKIYPK